MDCMKNKRYNSQTNVSDGLYAIAYAEMLLSHSTQ